MRRPLPLHIDRKIFVQCLEAVQAALWFEMEICLGLKMVEWLGLHYGGKSIPCCCYLSLSYYYREVNPTIISSGQIDYPNDRMPHLAVLPLTTH